MSYFSFFYASEEQVISFPYSIAVHMQQEKTPNLTGFPLFQMQIYFELRINSFPNYNTIWNICNSSEMALWKSQIIKICLIVWNNYLKFACIRCQARAGMWSFNCDKQHLRQQQQLTYMPTLKIILSF